MTQEDLKFIRWRIFAFHCQGIKKNHLSVSKDTLSDTLSQITHPFRYSLENINVSVHKKCLYNQVVQDHFFFSIRGALVKSNKGRNKGPFMCQSLKKIIENIIQNWRKCLETSPQRHSFMGNVA